VKIASSFRRDHALARLDTAIIALAVGLTAVTATAMIDAPLGALVESRVLDVAINVTATLVGAAVAILAWVRWRETRAPAALYESSAFLALSTVNALTLGLVFAGLDASFGLTPDRPSAGPVYLWTLARLSAAVLLVVGAVRGLRRSRPLVPAVVVAFLPTAALLVLGVVLLALGPTLPPLVPADAVFDRASVDAGPAVAAVAAVQAVVFCLFIVAAILYRRLFVRGRSISSAFLSVGLVIAAFSQVHFAFSPIASVGLVTSSDLLRVVFYAVLFLGIQAELEADLGALRRANVELERLREVDAANAALAERTRLAREIHDGLAQDLWYAKLKLGRLVQAPELVEDSRAAGREVLTAVDSALAEARQAVMAMRVDPSSGSTLADVLRSYVDDFGDRFALRTEFTAEPGVPRLPPRTEAEVLRIVQEAMNNVRKHADATLIRVRAECRDGMVEVTVTDNGRGFDPERVPDSRFGLRGMRERAELVGASLSVRSAPSDGTVVVFQAPLAGDAATS
jgi:signal transduction histidine kinase